MVLILCCDTFISAQTGKSLRKHVIVALDRYPGNNPLQDAGTMIPKMNWILNSVLSSDEDYISVVNYGLGTADRSFDKYAYCTVKWSTFETFRVTMNNYWEKIAYLNHTNSGKPCSMITGAKYYSFHSLYNLNDGKGANETFLLMVTDGVYNGNNDYQTEFQKGYKGIGGILDYTEFRNTIVSITQNYNFIFVKEFGIKGAYKAILFEVTPNQTTLNSVLDYPAYLGIHRVRGGYRMDFNYKNVSPSYRMHRLEICPLNDGEALYTSAFTEENGNAKLDIDGSIISGDTLKVVMRAWLEPKDTLYSGLIMSPYDDKYKNLTVQLSLPLNDDAKIFGLLPLYDIMWWWYPDNILYAVYVWDIVLAVIIIILMVYAQRTLSKRLRLYYPVNSLLSMKVKSSRNEYVAPDTSESKTKETSRTKKQQKRNKK